MKLSQWTHIKRSMASGEHTRSLKLAMTFVYGRTALPQQLINSTQCMLFRFPPLNMYRLAQHSHTYNAHHQIWAYMLNFNLKCSVLWKPTTVGCAIRLCFSLFICDCLNESVISHLEERYKGDTTGQHCGMFLLNRLSLIFRTKQVLRRRSPVRN